MTILGAYATLGELISHLTRHTNQSSHFLIRLFCSHRLSGCSLVVVKRTGQKKNRKAPSSHPRNR